MCLRCLIFRVLVSRGVRFCGLGSVWGGLEVRARISMVAGDGGGEAAPPRRVV